MGKPRFIAGAVCPHCRAVDRVRLTDSGRECVACGKVDEAPTNTDNHRVGLSTLPTRVNRGSVASTANAADAGRVEAAVEPQTVKFVEPSPSVKAVPPSKHTPASDAEEK